MYQTINPKEVLQHANEEIVRWESLRLEFTQEGNKVQAKFANQKVMDYCLLQLTALSEAYGLPEATWELTPKQEDEMLTRYADDHDDDYYEYGQFGMEVY
jgi:2-hydroxychromene-2-carboxylate isomerase